MVSKTKHIRKAINTILEPVILNAGFSGKYPNYHRKKENKLQVLAIMYNKWGGSLTLEFANTQPGDLETEWGEIVPEEKIEIGYIYLGDRARLAPNDIDDFFDYEKIYQDKDKCEELISSISSKFKQVEDWLGNRAVGENIRPFTI